MTTNKKDALYRFLHHLWKTNASTRKYQVYKHRQGIRISMDYTLSGVFETIAAIGDVYPKKKEPALDFTTDVRITSGPGNPPNIQITILPSTTSWIWELINEGKTLCELGRLIQHYTTNLEVDPLRKEVLDRLK